MKKTCLDHSIFYQLDGPSTSDSNPHNIIQCTLPSCPYPFHDAFVIRWPYNIWRSCPYRGITFCQRLSNRRLQIPQITGIPWVDESHSFVGKYRYDQLREKSSIFTVVDIRSSKASTNKCR